MSIVKFINVYNASKKDTALMHTYLSDNLKTDSGKLIYGLGFITNNYLDEFNLIKKANQKICGNQFRQITVSISPAGNNISDRDIMNIGRKIAEYHYRKGYQVLIYEHKDTYTKHLHFMLNTVNFITGKMFSQSKKELNRFKVHCNHVFNEYGLDIIKMQTEAMMDNVKHYISDGFECVELFEKIVSDKATVIKNQKVEENTSQCTSSPVNDYCCFDPSEYSAFAEYENTNIFEYLQEQDNKNYLQEVKTMDNTQVNQELPSIAAPQLPDTTLSKTGLTLDCSKNVNIIVPNDYSKDQLADLINSVEPVSEQDRAFNAKLGIGSEAELQNRGFEIPVYVDSSTNINITFDSVMNSNIFDIPYNKE